jgi:hypothetical protein
MAASPMRCVLSRKRCSIQPRRQYLATAWAAPPRLVARYQGAFEAFRRGPRA